MDKLPRRDFIKIGGSALAFAGLSETGQCDSPTFDGIKQENHEITGIQAVAPTCVEVGERFEIGVKVLTQPYPVAATCFLEARGKALDSADPAVGSEAFPSVNSATNDSFRGCTYMDNVPPSWSGRLQITSDSNYAGPQHLSFSDGPGLYPDDQRPICRTGPVHFTQPGIHYVHFEDPVTGVSKSTNPILVSESKPGERLFWGDIHMHTHFTDGIRSPEEVYYFGRDEAFLDICALTDHAEFYITDRLWEYFVNVTNDFNTPHEYVTIVAQEWTNHRTGHRCLYYPGDSAPILRATNPTWKQLPNLYAEARKHGALVVPHHSASARMGADWSLDHDPEVERLIEIYSLWGSSERPADQGNPLPLAPAREKKGQHVVDALAQGRKYGIIASGDIHDGRPGDSLLPYQEAPESWSLKPDHYSGGLMGVWANELTRRGVLDAMWNRRVFGTTGVRFIVRFSADGQPMGSTLHGRGAVPFKVMVESEVPVTQVDLVRNGVDYRQIRPEARSVDWEVEDRAETDPTWYYVRVTRRDGEMGWSSPIWVEA